MNSSQAYEQLSCIAVISLTFCLILRHVILENRVGWKKHKRGLNLNCHIARNASQRREISCRSREDLFLAPRVRPPLLKMTRFQPLVPFDNFIPFISLNLSLVHGYGKLLREFTTNNLLINISMSMHTV